MCRKQKLPGAVLLAAGVGILLGLLIGAPAVDFLLAAGFIIGGTFLIFK